MALTAKKSHIGFLSYLTSNLKYPLLSTQFSDFVYRPDVVCMSVLLKSCGVQIVSGIKENPVCMDGLLNPLAGHSPALETLLKYLIERLLANNPSRELMIHVLNMCSMLFRVLGVNIDEQSMTYHLSQMKYVMQTFDEVTAQYNATYGTLQPPLTLIDSDNSLLPMLSWHHHGEHVLKFMLGELDMDLSGFTLDSVSFLSSRGLATYLHMQNVPRAPIIVYDSKTMADALKSTLPSNILNAKCLIQKGTISPEMLKSYLTDYLPEWMHNLNDDIALGIIRSLAQIPTLADVVESLIHLRPTEE